MLPQTPHDRLCRAIRLEPIDRIPTIGGWIGGVRVLAELATTSTAEYLQDPMQGVLKAHHALRVDGMIAPVVPTQLDQVRTGFVEESAFQGREPEDLLRDAEAAPSDAEVLQGVDGESERANIQSYFADAHRTWDGIVPLPNFWDLGGHFPLYTQYGYEAFLGACALYPEAVERLWWIRSLVSRRRAEILAELIRDLNLVPALFCGEDLCNNQGPMVSPAFLRKHYFPTVRHIIEPLVESGVRLIHHCDGDIRSLAQDYLNLGFRGFQGFQYELDVSIRDLRQLRTAFGEPPVIWAGLSVTTTLPFGDEDAVRAEVESFVRDTDGGIGLCLFTSNVTGVEVPAANLRAGYTAPALQTK